MPFARRETDPVLIQVDVSIRRSRWLITGTNLDYWRAFVRTVEKVLKPEVRARVEPGTNCRDLLSIPYDLLPSGDRYVETICCQLELHRGTVKRMKSLVK